MCLRIFIFIFLSLVLNTYGIPQNQDAVALEYTTRCVVDNKEVTRYIRKCIQINNRNGDDYTAVAIPYSDDLRVSDLKAYIEDASGKVVKELRKNDIYDQNVNTGDLYNDRYMKVFRLGHNGYPFKLVYSYTLQEKNFLHLISWTPVVHPNIPTIDAGLSITIPRDISFRILCEGLNSKTSDSTDKEVKFNFEASYNAIADKEIYSDPQPPFVNIVPLNFTKTISGSWVSWKDYGEWVYNLNEGLDVLPETEKLKVRSLIEGKTDKMEIVRILYNYLQDNTRYINVSIGIGALKSFPAEYVCRNRYGDCKALSNYMKALLKEAGVSSNFAVIRSDENNGPFYKDFPSHQFNHMILMVPLEKDTLWLENTSTMLPMGYIHESIQNRPALIIDKGNSKLVMIPALSGEAVHEKKKINFLLVHDGAAKVKLVNEYRGSNFEYIRHMSELLKKEEKDLKIRNMMLFDNYEVDDWAITYPHRDSALIALDVNLRLHKFVNPLGSDLYFTLNKSGIPSFTPVSGRKSPVVLPIPLVITDSLEFHLPEGYRLKNQYEPVELTSQYGGFSMKITSDMNTVKVYRHFELNSGEYPLDVYPEFYKFIEATRKLDRAKLVITNIQ